MTRLDTGNVTEDALAGGRVRLLQPARGHRAGTDAVLLAGLCGARPGERVADLGSASGAVGLLLATRVEGLDLLFVDRDPALIDLARANIGLNRLARAEAVVADILQEIRPAGIEPADLVVTNPPYLGPEAQASPDPQRRRAHHLEAGGLAAWVAGVHRWLKPNGRLALIGRADRLGDIVSSLRPSMGGLAVRPIHPRPSEDASRVVVTARLRSRSPDRLLPPIVLHDDSGAFTPEAARLHAGMWNDDQRLGPAQPSDGVP